MMSNSAVRNGGATLFLTTFTRVRLPIDVGALLDRVDSADVQPHRGVELQRPPPVVVSGLPNMTPIFSRSWLVKMTPYASG